MIYRFQMNNNLFVFCFFKTQSWRTCRIIGVVAVEFVWPLWNSNLATIIKNHKVSTPFDPIIPLLGIYSQAIIKKTTKAMC